jgi:hypothetical protein
MFNNNRRRLLILTSLQMDPQPPRLRLRLRLLIAVALIVILTTLGRLRQIPRYGMWSELRILPPGTLTFVRYQINMNTIASSNNFNLLPFYVGQL